MTYGLGCDTMVLSIIELHDMYKQKFGKVPANMVRHEIVTELFNYDVKELYKQGLNKTEITKKLDIRNTDISYIENYLGPEYCRDKRSKVGYIITSPTTSSTIKSIANTTSTVTMHVCRNPEQEKLEQENKMLKDQLYLKKLKKENEKLKRELNELL